KLTIAVIGSDKRLETLLKDQKTEENEVITAKTEKEAVKKAKGEYISFVYAKDSIEPRYTQTILEKAETGFEVCYIGWQYIGWHAYRHIGFAGDFKPLFSTVYKVSLVKGKDEISDIDAKNTASICEIIYDYWGDKN
ncbi:MAG: hypothetical protein ACI4IK_02975, partial [Eubacterium sp.]